MKKPHSSKAPKQQAKRSKIGHEIRISAQPTGQRFTVRRNPDDNTRSVEGYFATFGTLSHNLGFREVLQKGCFAESLSVQPVACYRDHDAQMLLGKTASSTLSVNEDNKGLRFSVKLPDTSYANDLISLMERGDASECSFGFAVRKPEDEEWTQLPNGEILRTIKKAVLYEGSILTGNSAAYPSTSADLRNLPVEFRKKLKRGWEDSDDSDPCDESSDAYDADECEDQEEDRAECDCTCNECESGDCEDCSNIDCDQDDCLSCPAQTRAAHANLLLRRLK